MEFDLNRNLTGVITEPSLAEMVTKAIGVLSSNPQGYFLLVEGAEFPFGSVCCSPVCFVEEGNEGLFCCVSPCAYESCWTICSICLSLACVFCWGRKRRLIYFALSVPVPMKGAELFLAFTYHSHVYLLRKEMKVGVYFSRCWITLSLVGRSDLCVWIDEYHFYLWCDLAFVFE